MNSFFLIAGILLGALGLVIFILIFGRGFFQGIAAAEERVDNVIGKLSFAMAIIFGICAVIGILAGAVIIFKRIFNI